MNNRYNRVPDLWGRDHFVRRFANFADDDDDDNNNSRFYPKPDKETGVVATCPYINSCQNERLVYEPAADGSGGYRCYKCGRFYPYKLAPSSPKVQGGSGAAGGAGGSGGGDGRIRGLGDAPQRTMDHFILPHPREPRGLAAAIDPETASEWLKPELTKEQEYRESIGITHYEEREQVSAKNTYWGQDKADEIRKQKVLEKARRYNAMLGRGQGMI